MARRARQRAEAAAAPIDEPQIVLRSFTIETDACMAGLFTGCRYVPVRWFWRLVIDLDAPAEPRAPGGIEIRTLRDLDEAHSVHATLEEAVVFEKGLRG